MFLDKLIYDANKVGTPGVSHGPSGEGLLRLTDLSDRDSKLEGYARLKKQHI